MGCRGRWKQRRISQRSISWWFHFDQPHGSGSSILAPGFVGSGGVECLGADSALAIPAVHGSRCQDSAGEVLPRERRARRGARGAVRRAGRFCEWGAGVGGKCKLLIIKKYLPAN